MSIRIIPPCILQYFNILLLYDIQYIITTNVIYCDYKDDADNYYVIIRLSDILVMGNQLFIVEFSSGSIGATELIAEGGFSYVYQAEDRKGEKYALKKSIASYSDTDRIRFCKKEVAVLRSLPKHPNIVSFVNSVCLVNDELKQKHFYLLEELCECNVWDLMTPSESSQTEMVGLDERPMLAIFQDVCLALHHLHSQQPPIAHRDIKLENILLGFDGKAKLCDFGSCTWKHKYPPLESSELGLILDEIEAHTTLDIRAPEQVDIHSNSAICEKVDIWALGVVLFIMCTGRNPFAVPSTGVVEKLGIVNCRVSYPEPWQQSPCLRDIIAYLLTPDPAQRPSIFDVLSYCMDQKKMGNLSGWPDAMPDEAIWPCGNLAYMSDDNQDNGSSDSVDEEDEEYEEEEEEEEEEEGPNDEDDGEHQREDEEDVQEQAAASVVVDGYAEESDEQCAERASSSQLKPSANNGIFSLAV
jgi:serine/threonine protein kinase